MPKILLIISIVLIAASAVLGFLTLEQKIPALKQTLATTQANLKTTEGELEKPKTDLKANKEQLAATAEELKSTKSDLAATQEAVKAEKSKVASLTDENKNLTDQIADLNTKIPAVGPSGTPEEDPKVKALEAQVAELNQVNQSMTAKVNEVEGKAKSLEAELAHYKGQVRAKGLEGQVLAVNGAYQFVVLSLGDRQGVVMNAQMIIFRGDRMVAKVKVTSVEPSTSIADIIPGSGPRDFRVMPGDRVVYGGA